MNNIKTIVKARIIVFKEIRVELFSFNEVSRNEDLHSFHMLYSVLFIMCLISFDNV
jgi:hypothetical protein